MKPSYELFDHTADMGIRVRAATLPELLAPAGDGLYTVIGELVPGGESEPITFDLTGDEPATLLRDYLAELLILFESDGRIAASVEESTFDEHRLTVDRKRSILCREVKAITYHELDIRTIPGGHEATFIVDI